MKDNSWDKARKIANWVKNRHPEHLTRSMVMIKFRLNKAEMAVIEEILMTYTSVVVDPYPNGDDRKGTTIYYSLGAGDLFRPIPEVEGEGENEVESGPSVYFALAPSINRMKIGWTAGPPAYRVGNLNSTSPVEIILFGSIAGEGEMLERILHRRFGRHLVKGREWFTASEIVKAVIDLPGFTSATVNATDLVGVPDAHWTPSSWKKA